MTHNAIEKEELLFYVVRQKALQRPLKQVLLSNIFAVEQPWESDCLRHAPDMKIISSLAMLSEALLGDNQYSLLVTGGCGVTLGELAVMLGSVGRPFTIFMETYSSE